MSEYVKSCDLAKNTALQLTEMGTWLGKRVSFNTFRSRQGWQDLRFHARSRVDKQPGSSHFACLTTEKCSSCARQEGRETRHGSRATNHRETATPSLFLEETTNHTLCPRYTLKVRFRAKNHQLVQMATSLNISTLYKGT